MVLTETKSLREKAVVVSVSPKGADRDEIREHLEELTLLLDTADVDVVGRLTQEREHPDGATAIGRGKVVELAEMINEREANLVVFDDDLSPAQVRNLEKELKLKVLDRSGVIIDIFARRATSVEARTQVELAQLEYLLPRLTRMWTHLSKQYGGVGTRGPGETQIETDRRMFRGRIQKLKNKLEDIERHRSEQRKTRAEIPRFALVGYTNAGKSSVMNALTDESVHVEDRLFATLDTTVRRLDLPSGRVVLLSDTVGFIRKLPPTLIASFRSTLAEAVEADVLIHVVDVTSAHYHEHIAVVRDTLVHLGAANTPEILVFNKIDDVDDRHLFDDVESEYPGCLFISALRRINFDKLLRSMQIKVDGGESIVRVDIPWTDMPSVSEIYRLANVIDRTDSDVCTHLTVRVPNDMISAFERKFAVYMDGAHTHHLT